MDPYNTQYVSIGDTPTETGGGSNWLWAILVIVAIIAAIVFLILWLVNRNKNNLLALTNPRFNITSSNQMRATWDSINNSSDIVNLYVTRSGPKLDFTTDGIPTGSTTVVAKAGPVTSPTLTAIASPVLTSGVSYIGYLVVTNPNVNDYKSYVSQILTVGAVGPTGAFHIQANGQHGEIVYAVPEVSEETGATGAVGYNFSDVTTLSNNSFFYDSNQNICVIPPSLTGVVNNLDINANTTCADFNTSAFTGFVLTGNNSTLGIKQFKDSDTSNLSAKWVYDTSDQTWCLANSNGTSNKNLCMQLSSTNFNTLTGFTGEIDDFTLTVTNTGVVLRPGQIITGSGVQNGTIINSVGTAANTYIVNISQDVPEGTTMTAQTLTPINIASHTSSNAGWHNINFKLD